MWRDYFPSAAIVGLDINAVSLPEDRLRIYQGSQDDTELLDRIAAECGPFDIIIDDCAHIGALAKASFWHLFDRHLTSDGLYVIEDWGTGYMDCWPDGRRFAPPPEIPQEFPSHSAGMVGFLKQLIDECALTDIRSGGSGYKSPHRLIGRIDIAMGQAFIYPFRECSWLLSTP